MSIYSLCSGFTKIQKRCYKKNDMVQSHHFTEIASVTKKVSKKKSRLFTTRNRDICDTHDKNRAIAILCHDYIKKITMITTQIAT